MWVEKIQKEIPNTYPYCPFVGPGPVSLGPIRIRCSLLIFQVLPVMSLVVCLKTPPCVPRGVCALDITGIVRACGY